MVKREDLQLMHSLKLRGAYNMIAGLSADKRATGVITASAGNHAQGVTLSASRMGITALIVIPLATSDIKVDAVRCLQVEVLLLWGKF